VGLVLRARSSGLTFVVIRYFFLLGLFRFSIKTVGGGPTCQSLFDSLRSPYGSPFGRCANYAVQQQKK